MIIAYVSIISFSSYFYFHGVHILAYNGLLCLVLFIIFGVASYFTSQLLWLYRLAVLTAFHAVYFQVLFTGGALSPALMEFVIPPIIGFFYRPTRDRYLFMIVAVICILSFWPLSSLHYTKDYFPPEFQVQFHMIAVIFVLGVLAMYIYLYRRALDEKRKALKNSFLELQATSQKLIESEKMASLGMLSAGVAHEINNPLNFIKGGAEMLSSKFENFKEAQPFVQAIGEGVRRTTSIVNSLSHFSRNTPAMDELCDIHEIIDNCLIMLNHRLKYKVEVIKKYGDIGDLRIVGNEGKLHQAFLNIITNAEQAIKGKGTITIGTAVSKGKIEVSIADNGMGIEPKNLLKIKEPFFTTKGSGEGTGLGLSITYKVIEDHRGTIQVQSEVSKGTQFIITFYHPKRIDHPMRT